MCFETGTFLLRIGGGRERGLMAGRGEREAAFSRLEESVCGAKVCAQSDSRMVATPRGPRCGILESLEIGAWERDAES